MTFLNADGGDDSNRAKTHIPLLIGGSILGAAALFALATEDDDTCGSVDIVGEIQVSGCAGY